MTLEQIDTPALILDVPRMQRNIERMRARLEAAQVRFRPHLKTCKSADVAERLQPINGATVSTLREAEYFFEHGISDLLYAVGLTPDKLARVDRLQVRGARMTVILDEPEQARQLVNNATQLNLPLRVLIEIDSDGHRAGVPPQDGTRLRAIAKVLRGNDRLVLCGVMTHAGGAYNATDINQIHACARAECDAVLLSADTLRAAGVGVSIVSVGSTPTASVDVDRTGVTEVRPGVFVFQDLVMAGLGVCEIDDIALTVLTTVVGHREDRGWLIVDAGWSALSSDRGTASQALDQGYGLVCDITGQVIEDVLVSSTNQEHGIVSQRQGAPLHPRDYPIGTRLRVLPNHACATAMMHQGYHVLADEPGAGTVIAHHWTRCSGW